MICGDEWDGWVCNKRKGHGGGLHGQKRREGGGFDATWDEVLQNATVPTLGEVAEMNDLKDRGVTLQSLLYVAQEKVWWEDEAVQELAQEIETAIRSGHDIARKLIDAGWHKEVEK